MPPSVTIIIPTFNRAEFIVRAVQSVLAQTRPDLELIVVDDGSTDQTAEVLAPFRSRLTLLLQENRGPAAARNAGIRRATSPVIGFLDSDDRFLPRKLEVQLAAMEAAPEFLISHTQEIWYRRGRHLNQKNIHRKRGGDIFDHCLRLCAVSPSTALVRREVFEHLGLFDESMPACEDYDLWLRVSARYPFLLVDEPLTVKEGGRPDQVSVIHRVGMDRLRIRSILRILAAGTLPPEKEAAARGELIRKCHIYGQGCHKHGRQDEARHYLELADSWEQSRVGRDKKDNEPGM